MLGDGWAWEHEEEVGETTVLNGVETAVVQPSPMILPPTEIAEAIHTAAIMADIRVVHEQIAKLEQMDAKYQPVATELTRLAEQYEIQGIVDLLTNG